MNINDCVGLKIVVSVYPNASGALLDLDLTLTLMSQWDWSRMNLYFILIWAQEWLDIWALNVVEALEYKVKSGCDNVSASIQGSMLFGN